MFKSYKFFIQFHGVGPDEYRLYVVDRRDLDLFRAWLPDSSEITESEMNDYAYWIPRHAQSDGKGWRGGFPPRPDGRQHLTNGKRSAVAERLHLATEDARIATAQLLDRWIRGIVSMSA